MMKAAAEEERKKEVVNKSMPFLEMIHGRSVELGHRMTSMEMLCVKGGRADIPGDQIERRHGGPEWQDIGS